MAEKKKGFWSWLGFGKKEEPKQEPQSQETAEEKDLQAAQEPESEQSFNEKVEDKFAQLEESIEDKIEDIKQQSDIARSLAQKKQELEQFAERIEDNIEEKAERFENFFEEKKDQLEDFIEEQNERTERFFDQLEDSIEQKVDDIKDFIEEKAEKVKDFFDDVEDKVENTVDQVKTKIEQASEEESIEKREVPTEQAVENLTNFAKAEEKTAGDTEQELNRHEQLIHQLNEVIDAELQNEIQDKSEVEEAFEEIEELIAVGNDEEQADDVETAEERVDEIVEEKVEEITEEAVHQEEYQEKPAKSGFFSRLIQGLVKTKENIGSGFRNFFSGKKIDDELFEELEEQLLIADLGMPTTTKIIDNLTQHASKKQLKDAELLYQQLKIELAEVLKPVAQPLVLDDKKPYVILMVGVNGVGKTTTIGKLARKFQSEGKSVMLAAGDTFRAAAVEQLQVWGERNNIPVVAQATGSDSASVIFDAMQSAASKGIDVLIADTAGRLQNKNNLMDELKKIVRVMKKYDETAPHEIMLTLDAGTGQNAISQAKLFNEAVGLTGITLTKLDGTAKGGVIFAIADQFNIPIRYIGVGEKIEDLRPFNSEEFIEALFSHEDEK